MSQGHPTAVSIEEVDSRRKIDALHPKNPRPMIQKKNTYLASIVTAASLAFISIASAAILMAQTAVAEEFLIEPTPQKWISACS